jgi:trk system potassium uptake protein TrkH
MFKAETPGADEGFEDDPAHGRNGQGPVGGLYADLDCCTLGYHWAGMTWLDAIMHMFSTMGLGGFSSHDASFGFFDSPAIEAVSIASC